MEVSSETLVTSTPSMNVWTPKFWSTLSETEAPRSAYAVPTAMVAGLLPFMVMTGATVSPILTSDVKIVEVEVGGY